MGICTSDPLTYLITQYGDKVVKYVVSEKCQQYLDDTTPKLKERVQEQFKNSASGLDKEFAERQNTIKQNFNTTVADVKKSNPGVVESASQSQNKSQAELFGYNSVQSKFTELKAAKDGKLKSQQENIAKIIDDKKEELKKSIQQNKPSLPLFDSMPVCLKRKVMSDGEEKFAPQIKSKQQQLSGIFDKVTNLGNLDQTIKQVSGLNQMDSLVKNSSSTFQKAKKLLTMGSNPKSCFG